MSDLEILNNKKKSPNEKEKKSTVTVKRKLKQVNSGKFFILRKKKVKLNIFKNLVVKNSSYKDPVEKIIIDEDISNILSDSEYPSEEGKMFLKL
jgi:hypothetical protein